MTTLDLQAIHEALAVQLEAGVSDAGDFTFGAHPLTADRPAIEVWPDTDYVDFYGASGPDESSDVLLMVRVFLSGANAESEWLTVCGLISSGPAHGSSIFDAVKADPTLGGVVDGTHITGARWNPEDGSIDIPVAIRLC
jgi:hypothetical protein